VLALFLPPTIIRISAFFASSKRRGLPVLCGVTNRIKGNAPPCTCFTKAFFCRAPISSSTPSIFCVVWENYAYFFPELNHAGIPGFCHDESVMAGVSKYRFLPQGGRRPPLLSPDNFHSAQFFLQYYVSSSRTGMSCRAPGPRALFLSVLPLRLRYAVCGYYRCARPPCDPLIFLDMPGARFFKAFHFLRIVYYLAQRINFPAPCWSGAYLKASSSRPFYAEQNPEPSATYTLIFFAPLSRR